LSEAVATPAWPLQAWTGHRRNADPVAEWLAERAAEIIVTRSFPC
jgi:hypothetical protein